MKLGHLWQCFLSASISARKHAAGAIHRNTLIMLDKNTFGEPVDCDTLFSFFFENNISIFTGPGTRNHKIDIVQIA